MLGRLLRFSGAATVTTFAGAYTLYRYERSKVPDDSELIQANSAPASPPVEFKKLTVDNLMGGYDAYYLGGVFFYDQPVDASVLRATLKEAVEVMPALAGRRTSSGIVLSNAGLRFSSVEGRAGSARDWIGEGSHMEAPRGDFADMPSACTGGEQPLFTVRVTNFADGTSAVGIASPHSFMDGKSYFVVVNALAAAFAQGGSFKGVKTPASFDGASVWEECTKSMDVSKQPTMWMPVKLLEAAIPFWALAMKRLDSMLPRAKVHLTQSELAQLKAAVGATLGGGGGGGACTTNEALSAAFFVALAESDTGPFAAGQPGIVRMVVNAQGRGLFSGVDNIAGNFSWRVDNTTPKPPREMSMVEAAKFFVDLGAKWRDDASATACVQELATFYRVMDLTGWLWAQTDSVDNTLFMNNQTSLGMSAVHFGRGSLLNFHPWHSHQHVQIVEAPSPAAGGGGGRLAGGADVYLPKMYSPLLGTEAFKERLLRGWQQK